MTSLAVIYLARAAEGGAPVREFVRSYRAHDPGLAHRLVVLLKGHDDAGAEAARRELDLPCEYMRVPDIGFDIGAYLTAANLLDDEWVCCLNTFARIEAAGWLDHLVAAATRPEVGLVSATGSFESQFSTNDLYRRARPRMHDPAVRRYLHPFIFGGVEVPTPGRVRLQRLLGEARGDAVWLAARQALLGSLFRRFPNPHVRTNGFVMRRALLAQASRRLPRNKRDALIFESGRRGLSRSIERRGLGLRVVGRDGRAHAPPEWPGSATFRTGGHANLLISDNQTRWFDALPPEQQATLRRVSWGDYLEPGPSDFPHLGVRFGVRPRRVEKR